MLKDRFQVHIDKFNPKGLQLKKLKQNVDETTIEELLDQDYLMDRPEIKVHRIGIKNENEFEAKAIN